MKKLIRSRPHLGGECRSKPIVPYYRDQKGELNGQKETTLPMRKLIRSGTLLGGGAPIYFLLNGKVSVLYTNVQCNLRILRTLGACSVQK